MALGCAFGAGRDPRVQRLASAAGGLATAASSSNRPRPGLPRGAARADRLPRPVDLRIRDRSRRTPRRLSRRPASCPRFVFPDGGPIVPPRAAPARAVSRSRTRPSASSNSDEKSDRVIFSSAAAASIPASASPIKTPARNTSPRSGPIASDTRRTAAQSSSACRQCQPQHAAQPRERPCSRSRRPGRLRTARRATPSTAIDPAEGGSSDG